MQRLAGRNWINAACILPFTRLALKAPPEPRLSFPRAPHLTVASLAPGLATALAPALAPAPGCTNRTPPPPPTTTTCGRPAPRTPTATQRPTATPSAPRGPERRRPSPRCVRHGQSGNTCGPWAVGFGVWVTKGHPSNAWQGRIGSSAVASDRGASPVRRTVRVQCRTIAY